MRIPYINTSIDLLIGTNASKLMEPWEVINSREDGPYVIRTLLGWVINYLLQGSCEGNHLSIYATRTVIDRIKELLTSQYNNNFKSFGGAGRAVEGREEVCRDTAKLCSASERT